MRNAWFLAVVALVVASSALGLDAQIPGPSRDAQYELSWDNGAVGLSGYWLRPGEGCWKGNDFSVATLGSTATIVKLRCCSGAGNNSVWDGMRFAVFSYTGIPGAIMWPPSGTPAYAVGSGAGWQWFDVPVNFDLPLGTTSFLAAEEQYYNEANADPWLCDTAAGLGHTWETWPGNGWQKQMDSWHNLMLRAVVSVTSSGVAPNSLGRIKALYF